MALQEKIKSILDEGGVSYHQNTRSFILTCPRCNKPKKLYLRKTDGRFVCWVCKDVSGFSGKAEWCLTELIGTPVKELQVYLYGATNNQILLLDVEINDFFDEEDEFQAFQPEVLPEVMPDPDFRPLAGTEGEKYLLGRGIPLSVAEQYGIMYYPKRKSVVFPVASNSKLLGWQTRVVGPTRWFDEELQVEVRVPKAMTSVGLKKDRTFMFGDRLSGVEHAILCEGPIDAIKAHLCGGNIATLGKVVSATQLNLLLYSGVKRLYLALDPDAFMEAGKVLRELSGRIDVYDLRPPAQYSDLGDMPLEEVFELFKAAPKLYPQHIFMYLENHYES